METGPRFIVPSDGLEKPRIEPATPGLQGSFLWDIGKQNSLRCDATERGVPSGAILFAKRNFIEKCNRILKSYQKTLKLKMDSSK